MLIFCILEKRPKRLLNEILNTARRNCPAQIFATDLPAEKCVAKQSA